VIGGEDQGLTVKLYQPEAHLKRPYGASWCWKGLRGKHEPLKHAKSDNQGLLRTSSYASNKTQNQVGLTPLIPTFGTHGLENAAVSFPQDKLWSFH